MQVVYYCQKWFATGCYPLLGDIRDDVSRISGISGSQWIVPGTYPEHLL